MFSPFNYTRLECYNVSMIKMKKIFKETDITWKRLIIFAILIGLYTGLTTLIPAFKNTSFADISISFEWWILFGIFIILNSKTPLDSALKCFVFFLISQPLVYLIQVPFYKDSWAIFACYKTWFIWTLFTFPMGYIGYFLKKDKWYGLLILVPIMLILGAHFIEFLNETIVWFPHHLLSAIFCFLTLFLYPIITFENKKIRNIGILIAILIILGSCFYSINSKYEFYSTDILASTKEEKLFDDSYNVYLEDEAYGEVSIIYDENSKYYLVHAIFKKAGNTKLILTSPNNETTIYDLTIDKNTFEIKKEN